MHGNIYWLIGFILCFDTFSRGLCLQCWKCISDDCETDPTLNNNAVKVNCQEGERCMKARYRMFDNVTHYDAVIRTCTTNPCNTSSVDEFFNCVATPRLHMIGGCSFRSCCNDRDLCNSGKTVSVTSHVYMSLIVIFSFYESLK